MTLYQGSLKYLTYKWFSKLKIDKKKKPLKISILQPFSRVGLVSMFHECQIKKPLMTSSSCKRRNLKFLNPTTSSSNYEL